MHHNFNIFIKLVNSVVKMILSVLAANMAPKLLITVNIHDTLTIVMNFSVAKNYRNNCHTAMFPCYVCILMYVDRH